jgi:hypothetical protein
MTKHPCAITLLRFRRSPRQSHTFIDDYVDLTFRIFDGELLEEADAFPDGYFALIRA